MGITVTKKGTRIPDSVRLNWPKQIITKMLHRIKEHCNIDIKWRSINKCIVIFIRLSAVTIHLDACYANGEIRAAIAQKSFFAFQLVPSCLSLIVILYFVKNV